MSEISNPGPSRATFSFECFKLAFKPFIQYRSDLSISFHIDSDGQLYFISIFDCLVSLISVKSQNHLSLYTVYKETMLKTGDFDLNYKIKFDKICSLKGYWGPILRKSVAIVGCYKKWDAAIQYWRTDPRGTECLSFNLKSVSEKQQGNMDVLENDEVNQYLCSKSWRLSYLCFKAIDQPYQKLPRSWRSCSEALTPMEAKVSASPKSFSSWRYFQYS